MQIADMSGLVLGSPAGTSPGSEGSDSLGRAPCFRKWTGPAVPFDFGLPLDAAGHYYSSLTTVASLLTY